MDNFAVFILSNGRPGNIKTLTSLNRHGYTGKIYIIIDDEDPTKDQYINNFKEKVIIFNKEEVLKKFDIGTNKVEKRAIIFARNACFDIAEKLKIQYFIQLDDDYTDFRYVFDLN